MRFAAVVRKLFDRMRLKISDRIAAGGAPADLEAAIADKEAVRRGSSLFALPPTCGLKGAKLVWGTADDDLGPP